MDCRHTDFVFGRRVKVFNEKVIAVLDIQATQINGDGLDLKVHTKAMATMMLVEAVTNGEAAEGVPCRVRAVHKFSCTTLYDIHEDQT